VASIFPSRTSSTAKTRALQPEGADQGDDRRDQREQDRDAHAVPEQRRKERVQQVDDQVDDQRDHEEAPEELRVEPPGLAEDAADAHAGTLKACGGRSRRNGGRGDRPACAKHRAKPTTLSPMPTPRDILEYMRTVSRGSPVDPRWSVGGMVLSQLRHGRRNAPHDSPLTLQDVLASEDYRNLMTAKVAVGDAAPDFELPRLDGGGTVRLGSLAATQPVALIFGSYT
jgi:hypothetical protein